MSDQAWKSRLERFFYDRATGIEHEPTLMDHCMVSAKDPRLATQPEFHSDLIDSLLEQMEIGAQSDVLEVGCASGYIACGLAPKVGRYEGVDLAAMPIVLAKKMKLLNAQFQQADGGKLPFADGSFDAAFVCDVLSNFPAFSDAEPLLSELVRVVKPGGRAMVASITDAAKAQEFQQHVYAVADELTAKYGPLPQTLASGKQGYGLVDRLKRRLKGVPPPPSVEPAIVNYNFEKADFQRFAEKRSLEIAFHDVHRLNPYRGYRFNVVLKKPRA